MEYLGINYTETERNNYLNPFLKGFLIESIKSSEEEEYNFKSLIGVFFILSNSNFEEKTRSIFRLFDDANDNQLNEKELNNLLTSIFESVLNYSSFLFNDNLVLEKFNFSNSMIKLKMEEKINLKQKNVSLYYCLKFIFSSFFRFKKCLKIFRKF